MNILLTGARAPVTLELIRAFGRQGYRVFAADTTRLTLGAASRYLAGFVVTPPPRYDPPGFAHTLAAALKRHKIDWLIPTCEEIFYVGRFHAELGQLAQLLVAPLPQLDRLHNKFSFQRLAAELSLPTPRTALLHSRAALEAALPNFPHYLLKPAYSRFAARVISNCGPRTGRVALESCRPTPHEPWLIQEFIAGESLCSYTILHNGRVTGHCAYTTPYKADQGSGVYFVARDEPASLVAAERIGAALGFTGQLSLDFICGKRGPVVIECNPRTTSGVHLMDAAELIGALTDPCHNIHPTPPGRVRQIALATLAGAADPTVTWRTLLRDMPRAADVIFAPDDPLPALAQLAVTARFALIAARRRISLTEATTVDIEWNGA